MKVVSKENGKVTDVLQIVEGTRMVAIDTPHVCRRGDGVVRLDHASVHDFFDFTPRELGATTQRNI